ncbi:MAG: DMT family transporter [Bacillota bacterium]
MTVPRPAPWRRIPAQTPSARPAVGPLIALSACALAWGGSFVAAKIALVEIDPMGLAALRFFVACLVFVPVIIGYHFRGERLTLAELPSFLVLGLLGVTTYFWLQFAGIRHTTATNVALLITLTPVWTSLLGRFFLGEELGGRRVTGIALAFAGAIVVATRGRFSLSAGREDLIGALYILSNTLAWSVFTTLGRSALQRRPALFVTAWVGALGTLMMLPALVYVGEFRGGVHLDAKTWTAVIYLGVICSALGYFLWYYALKQVRASLAAGFLYLQPLVTIALSRVLLGETLTVPTVVGGAAIIAGVYRISASPRWTRRGRRAA